MLTTISILMCHAAWISWTACHGWTRSETHHSSACCHCCLVTHLLPHPRHHLLLEPAHCQRFAELLLLLLPLLCCLQHHCDRSNFQIFEGHAIFQVCLVQHLCMLQTFTCHGLRHIAYARVSNLGSKPEGKSCVRRYHFIVRLHLYCAAISVTQ